MELTMKDVMTANCAIQHAEMLTSNHCAALARELNKMLAAAPVPPAGGEVEVFAYYLHPLGDLEHGRFLKREDAKIADPSKSDHHGTIVLVDRAHITRLTAENARLKDEVTTQYAKRVAVVEERDALQSELTKARELVAIMSDAELVHERMQAAQDLKTWANQYVPAAKDGE